VAEILYQAGKVIADEQRCGIQYRYGKLRVVEIQLSSFAALARHRVSLRRMKAISGIDAAGAFFTSMFCPSVGLEPESSTSSPQHAYGVDATGSEIVLSDEHVGYRWIPNE
jgi:hypothetical protein